MEFDLDKADWGESFSARGKISKSQLLDLLLAIYQPPEPWPISAHFSRLFAFASRGFLMCSRIFKDNEDDDLDATFKDCHLLRLAKHDVT